MKKIIAVFLAVILCFLTSVSVYGMAEREVIIPTVVVSGMNFNGLVIDQGTENERSTLGEINAFDIISTLGIGLAKTLVFMDADGLTTSILNYAAELFKGYSCDDEGNSVYNVSMDHSYPEAVINYPKFTEADNTASAEKGVITTCIDEFGAENTYFYYYDWRLDPFDICDGLNDLVNLALEESGSDKVNIIC